MDKNFDDKSNGNGIARRSFLRTENSIVILFMIATMFYIPFLGNYSLLGEWETLFGRAALEMMASNSLDWFLDPLYQGKYDLWSKPVLCYWMVFPFIKIFGPTEFALRLPFALNGIFFALLVFYLAKKLVHDDFRAFLAGLITIFTPFTFLISRQFMWEITLTTFITGGSGFLFLGWREKNRKYLYAAYLCMGLGILTKGLIALLIPLIIFFIFSISTTDYSKGAKASLSQLFNVVKEIRILTGVLIVLAVSSWWFIYMGIKHGLPFLNQFFVQHHINLLAGKLNKPDGPFEFYIWELSVGTFPWIAFFIPGLIMSGKALKEKKEELFIITAFFVPFFFFTLSGTKFPHYIFSVVPFFAMITSFAFVKLLNRENIKELYPFFAIIGALTVGIIGKDLGTGLNYTNFLNIVTTHKIENSYGRIFDMVPFLKIVVPLMVALILLPMLLPAKKWLIRFSAIGFIVVSIVFAGYLNFIWIPQVVEVFSSKQIVKKIYDLKKDGDLIVDYDTWKTKSTRFYLGIDEELITAKNIKQVQNIVKNNPENSIFIILKEKDVAELRAKLFAELGVNVNKITDDKVDTYKEIELYRVSIKDKVPEEKQKWRKNIIEESALPKDLKKLGGTFDKESIEIIGYTTGKGRYNAGEELEMTVFYRAKKEIEKSWQIFFHFDVYSGALPRSFKFDDFPLQGFYPTNQWQPGEIIRQEVKTQIPPDHPGGGIKIYTGFYIDRDRLPVDRENDNDGQDRFILGTFRVNIK